MRRPVTLRQVESFKAVVEHGTVSRAAEMLNVSQPAVSRLVANLELDTGLKLFDRAKGRLLPTEHAMHLFDEIGRIFAGVRQVDNAIDAILREKQGRVSIGVLPALSGSFIQRAVTGFARKYPDVFCSIESTITPSIIDSLTARRLDIGIINGNVENRYVASEPLLEHPLVCIMPIGHPLADKESIEPPDVDGIPFIAYSGLTNGALVEKMFDTYRIKCNKVFVSNVAPTVCELVAAGLGIALVHPLVVSGLEKRLVVRRFLPEIQYSFLLCRNAESRNARFAEAFAEEVLATADQISRSII